jgi:hypothetical protein
LAGTGDPFTIYDTDGTTKLLAYSTASGKLSIIGDGSFTGNLSIGLSDAIFKAEPTVGIWLGNQIYGSAPFSVSKNGVIKADSGTIGGWTLADSYLQNSAGTFQINSNASTIYVGPYASGDHIRISSSGGIQHTNSAGSATGKFTLSPNGNLTLSGSVTITSGDTYDAIQNAQSDANAAQSTADTANSTANSAYSTASTAIQPGNGVSLNSGAKTINTILMNSSGIKITTASSGTRLELSNSGLYLYNGSTPTVALNAATGNAEFTGKVTANEGSFTGSLYSSTGTLGGWTLGTDTISATGLTLTSATGLFGAASIKYGASNSFATAFEPATSNFLIYNLTQSKYSLSINESTNVVKIDTSAPVLDGTSSGGLRNIYTATSYTGNTQYSTSAEDGDILIVYTA